ncbi:YhcB family protein [Aliiglaciecola sp.]|nr:YhcB family protein [Aliiglaciecola sp.]
MDWIVGVLLLVVGMILGFFIAKFILEQKLAEQESKSSDNTLKEMLAQHAADHLSQSREIVSSLQTRCEDLSEQLDAYENVLNASQADNSENLTFFGEHATVFIRHQQAKQKRKRETPEFQPRDFSGESTGLFTDAKTKQLADND